jgi:hypothetical protein
LRTYLIKCETADSHGAPIPVGIIDPQIDGTPPLALTSSQEIVTNDTRDEAADTSMSTADALMLAPFKLGFASILVAPTFACNPFFAASSHKLSGSAKI